MNTSIFPSGTNPSYETAGRAQRAVGRATDTGMPVSEPTAGGAQKAVSKSFESVTPPAKLATKNDGQLADLAIARVGVLSGHGRARPVLSLASALAIGDRPTAPSADGCLARNRNLRGTFSAWSRPEAIEHRTQAQVTSIDMNRHHVSAFFADEDRAESAFSTLIAHGFPAERAQIFRVCELSPDRQLVLVAETRSEKEAALAYEAMLRAAEDLKDDSCR